jgi:hypothetical protein
VTPIDQDTIVRVTINGKKPAISKGFFLIKLLQKALLPQGEHDECKVEKLKKNLKYHFF